MVVASQTTVKANKTAVRVASKAAVQTVVVQMATTAAHARNKHKVTSRFSKVKRRHLSAQHQRSSRHPRCLIAKLLSLASVLRHAATNTSP